MGESPLSEVRGIFCFYSSLIPGFLSEGGRAYVVMMMSARQNSSFPVVSRFTQFLFVVIVVIVEPHHTLFFSTSARFFFESAFLFGINSAFYHFLSLLFSKHFQMSVIIGR